MPAQTLGKRSSSTKDLNDDLENPRSKLQKRFQEAQHRRVQLALADIAKKVQRSNLEEAILSNLGGQSGLAKQILDLQASIHTAIHKSIPFEPGALVEWIGKKIEFENYCLPTYDEEVVKPCEVRAAIMDEVSELFYPDYIPTPITEPSLLFCQHLPVS